MSPIVIDGRDIDRRYRLGEELDALYDLLGSNKTNLLPFADVFDARITQWRPSHDHEWINRTSAGAETDIFNSSIADPTVHGEHGLVSLFFLNNSHLSATDAAQYSFTDNTLDEAFSIGMWIKRTGNGTLMAKYDAAGFDREWKFDLTSGALRMELYDDTANASEITDAGDTSLDLHRWYFVTMTYDGNQAAPVINLYVNGVSDNDGTTTETGSYVAMQGGATGPLIGTAGPTGTAVNGYAGRIALPFICGKELSVSEVMQVYSISQRMLGMP